MPDMAVWMMRIAWYVTARPKVRWTMAGTSSVVLSQWVRRRMLIRLWSANWRVPAKERRKKKK
jgi:hypothetical protein